MGIGRIFITLKIWNIDKEVNINNNSSYMTGYSSLTSIMQNKFPGIYGNNSFYNQPYNTETGSLAGTTGNISGIYDMGGGAHEYVMAFIDNHFNQSGLSSPLLSNYNSKYYDIYSASSSLSSYQYRILGMQQDKWDLFFRYSESDGSYYQHNICIMMHHTLLLRTCLGLLEVVLIIMVIFPVNLLLEDTWVLKIKLLDFV